jgi:arginyl-tRNA synthetase
MVKALKYEVLNRLQSSLNNSLKALEVPTSADEDIPLHRGKNCTEPLYISGVILQRSKSSKIPVQVLATAIVSHFSEISQAEFTINFVEPGWIHVRVNPTMLAAWLQSVASGELEHRAGGRGQGAGGRGQGAGCRGQGAGGRVQGRQGGEGSNEGITHYPLPITHSLFPIQYAHARCCSLLRMAHREGLITLQPEPDNHPLPWSVIAPAPIPWLNSAAQLHLVHPAENRLIAKLVQVIDDFYCTQSHNKVNWEKVALDLSQAFVDLWSACRIWGEVKRDEVNLAQARLGLVMAVESVLRLLLQDCLGVVASKEL